MAQYFRSLSKLPSAYISSGPAFLPKPLELVQLGSINPRHLNPAFRAVSAAPLKVHSSYVHRRRHATINFPRAQSLSTVHYESCGHLEQTLNASPRALEEEDQSNLRDSKKNKSPLDGKPSPEQLQRVHDVLVDTLPHVFTKQQDYRIFSPDVILVDNIRGKTYRGLLNYIRQVAWLRIVGHWKFAFVKLELLNSSIDPLEGRVIIRWRIKGISGLRVFVRFWQYKLWKWKELMNHQETWHDGISYYDVSAENGVITRHTIDKVTEDKDQALDDSTLKKKLQLASKLAGASSALVSPMVVGTIHNLGTL